MTTITARQRWQRAYSDARYERWPNNVDPVQMAAFRLRYPLFRFFGPAFGRAFSAPFDRSIAAAAVPWYLAGGAPAPIAVYQPKGAADLAASYINLITPGTYNAAPGVAPGFDASGWVGNNSAYLKTGITPGSGWSALCRFSDLSTSDNDQVLLGGYTGANNYLFLQPRFVNTVSHYYGNGGISAAKSGRLATGVMAVADSVGYLDGVSDATGIAAWSGTGKPLYILAVNNNNTLVEGFVTGKVQAVAIWSTSTNHATWMPAVSAACALI